MDCHHAYHCFCDGLWRPPLSEHLAMLTQAGFTGSVTIGLVGSVRRRQHARNLINRSLPDVTFIDAEDGWEQVTLAHVRDYAGSHDGAVMYAHTKGAANPGRFQADWRQSMSRHVVGGWRECVERLEAEQLDAIGCHWLTPGQHRYPVAVPFFGGNYWIATCEYLRRLPVCSMANRHEAEVWIGRGNPNVADLKPGWPSPNAFRAAA
jgi:hypothetical protein